MDGKIKDTPAEGVYSDTFIKYVVVGDPQGTIPGEADLTAYNAALNAVNENDYTPASWAVYQAVVNANQVTAANTQAEVDAATDAIVAAQADLVMDPDAVTAEADFITELLGIRAYEITLTNADAADVTEVRVDGAVNTNWELDAGKILVNVTTGVPTTMDIVVDGVTVPVTIN